VTDRATSPAVALHPTALGALVLLIVNDHVLKALYPGWLTGKLSDVAGLAVFPLLVAAGGQLVGLWPGRLRTVVAIALVTGAAFAAIKLCSTAGDLYRIALAALQWPVRAMAAALHGAQLPAMGRAHLTPDRTDLLALPALIASPRLVARAWRRPRAAPGAISVKT
jgi:hypothetical protein